MSNSDLLNLWNKTGVSDVEPFIISSNPIAKMSRKITKSKLKRIKKEVYHV
jgi:hypothetical protein